MIFHTPSARGEFSYLGSKACPGVALYHLKKYTLETLYFYYQYAEGGQGFDAPEARKFPAFLGSYGYSD